MILHTTVCRYLAFAALSIWTVGFPLRADTISSNLTSTSGGTEATTGDTWLAASFLTNSTSYSLTSVTIPVADSTATSAAGQLSIYSDDGLNEPGVLVGTLVTSSSYSTALNDITFTSRGVALSSDSTYWVVLSANTGQLNWSYAADDNGTGAGFTDTWAQSYDAGSSWYVYASNQSAAVDPLQMEVSGTAALVATPEPASAGLAVLGFLLCAGRTGYRFSRQRGMNLQERRS